MSFPPGMPSFTIQLYTWVWVPLGGLTEVCAKKSTQNTGARKDPRGSVFEIGYVKTMLKILRLKREIYKRIRVKFKSTDRDTVKPTFFILECP